MTSEKTRSSPPHHFMPNQRSYANSSNINYPYREDIQGQTFHQQSHFVQHAANPSGYSTQYSGDKYLAQQHLPQSMPVRAMTYRQTSVPVANPMAQRAYPPNCLYYYTHPHPNPNQPMFIVNPAHYGIPVIQNTPAAYPQTPPTMVPTVQQTPLPMPSHPQPAQQRKSHAVRIIDPQTSQEVKIDRSDEQKFAPTPPSTESSSRASPGGISEEAQEFMRQVVATTNTSSKDRDQSPNVPLLSDSSQTLSRGSAEDVKEPGIPTDSPYQTSNEPDISDNEKLTQLGPLSNVPTPKTYSCDIPVSGNVSSNAGIIPVIEDTPEMESVYSTPLSSGNIDAEISAPAAPSEVPKHYPTDTVSTSQSEDVEEEITRVEKTVKIEETRLIETYVDLQLAADAKEALPRSTITLDTVDNVTTEHEPTGYEIESQPDVETDIQNIPVVIGSRPDDVGTDVVERESSVYSSCEENEFIPADENDDIAESKSKRLQRSTNEEFVTAPRIFEVQKLNEANQKEVDESLSIEEPQAEAPDYPPEAVTSSEEPVSKDVAVDETTDEYYLENENATDEKGSESEQRSKNSSPVNEEPERKNSTTYQLKYKYKEDQWSPLNPEGKKQYDRDFLIALQYTDRTLIKPPNLPDMDIVFNEPFIDRDKKLMSSISTLSGNDFIPQFIRSHSRGNDRSGNILAKRGSREALRMRGNERRVITNVVIPTDVKLHSVEKAWKPARKTEKIDDPEKEETEEIYKKMRSILNKLTPQKFETLIDQVSALNVNSDLRLEGVVALIFEKAIDEPNFSVAYANMCKKLSVLGFGDKIDPKKFKTILLTSCQREYEKDHDAQILVEKKEAEINAAPDNKKDQLREDLELDLMKLKRRILGNVRFIGELYKLRMLNDKVMHNCINNILTSDVDEEKLECLCHLMSTIGKELDTEYSKEIMGSYFAQLKKLSNKKGISCRIRFKIQDTIELRQNNWVPRRQENNPKTIDEVHNEIKEEQKKDEQKKLLLQSQKNLPKPARLHSGGSAGSDGWTNVLPKSNRIDPTKFKQLSTGAHKNHDDVQLGSFSNFSQWGRGAGSSKPQETDKSAPANRFSALSYNDEDNKRNLGITSNRSDSRQYPSSRDTRASVKNFPSRGSMERDREKGPNQKNMSLRPQTQSPSRVSTRSPAPEVQDYPSDVICKKSQSILDEYLSNQSIDDAIVDVKKICHSQYISNFISVVMNEVFERSTVARMHTAKLLRELLNQRVLSLPTYIQGLTEVMSEAPSNAVDVPKIWEYLGELIGPLIASKSVSLRAIRDPILRVENKAGKLMSEILHFVASKLGHEPVAQIWRESGLQWEDFNLSCSVSEFLRSHKLEFTVTDRQVQTTSDLRLISAGLSRILERAHSNEEVFGWIEENVDKKMQSDIKFIRVLMKSVCSSVIIQNYKLDKDLFKSRGCDGLLLKYLDHDADRELNALYALQELVFTLKFPSGLLQSFFDSLYDEDVISEEALKQWLDSSDPNEEHGKGVAKGQVVQFFESLKEDNS